LPTTGHGYAAAIGFSAGQGGQKDLPASRGAWQGQIAVSESKKVATRLTKTLAFRQMVAKTLEAHKPDRCLMTEVFNRGACDH
jgi:hypothetical protein